MNENPYGQCQECGKNLTIPERGKLWCNSCRIKQKRHEEIVEAMKKEGSTKDPSRMTPDDLKTIKEALELSDIVSRRSEYERIKNFGDLWEADDLHMAWAESKKLNKKALSLLEATKEEL